MLLSAARSTGTAAPWRALFARALLVPLTAFGVTLGPACSHEFDTTRVVPERQSLGAEMYYVFCQRLAASELPTEVTGEPTKALCRGQVEPSTAPTARLRVMAEQRDRLVAALDRAFPEVLEDDLDYFTLQLIPFYDPPEERLPTQTRALADLFAKILEDDEAIAALERVGSRLGYRPSRLALGVARPALSYPRIVELTQTALGSLAEGGHAHEEWNQLVGSVALDMATAAPAEPEDGPSTLELTRQLLLTTRPEFGEGGARFMAVRDPRGVVIPFSGDGSVPPPFADMDGNGLADIDPLGRFLDRSGGLLDVPSPFALPTEPAGVALRGPAGRALRADSSPLYSYRDVNHSLLAGLSRDAAPWLDPASPTLLDMAYGLPVLMGPRAMRTEDLGPLDTRYLGYDTANAPLFDLIYATGELLHRDATDDALQLVDALVTDHEAEVAGMIHGGLISDAYADGIDAAIPAESELWDDVLQVAQWIAQEPGLLEGLLRSFADPRAKRLGSIFAEMMRFRDPIALDPDDINRHLTDQVWTMEVDRDAPDGPDNMSLFQRTVSAIHDLGYVRVCNKDGARLRLRLFGLNLTYPLFGGSYDECELLEIQDVAEAFALSVIGRYELEIKDEFLAVLLDVGGSLGIDADRTLEESSGIDGLTRTPTPQALARMVYTRDGNEFLESLVDPPPTRDGVPMVERHPDPVVFAWERSFRFCGDELVAPGTVCADAEEVTFYEALSPLLEAFDNFDRRTDGRFLFTELISALHLHWPGPDSPMTQDDDPSAPFFANHDDGRSYEPIVANLFADCEYVADGSCDPERAGGMVRRLHELGLVLDATEIRPGVDGFDVLAAASEDLIDPQRNLGLADRAGRTMTATNGGRPIPQTPLHLLLDSLGRFDAAFAAAEPDRLTRWRSARSDLVDQLLTTRIPPGARDRYELANRRTYGLARVLVPFLRERIADHRRRGDLQPWARGLAGRMETSMNSTVGAAALGFLEAVQTDDASRDELSGMMQYLMSEESGFDAFDTMVLSTADLMQVLDDDLNIVPLLHVLSEGMSPGVRDVVASGALVDPAELPLAGSALDETMDLMRALADVDDRRVLPRMLGNLVSLPESGAGETPLETIIDVVAEVHRVEPGVGGSLLAPDHRRVLDTAHEFLTDEDRGIERIYNVIQARELED